ncbi:MAG: PP2C family serine/threonine-protein phosphatase [Betaproteobacteria bacterium]
MGWIVVGSSVTGAGHIEKGEGCQDYSCHRLVGDALIAVVCDGAGSHTHSRQGAEAAAQSICASPTLEAWVLEQAEAPDVPPSTGWRSVTCTVFAEAIAAVQREAVRLAVPFKELSSTAILTVATPGFLAVAHVGDGRCCAAFQGEASEWQPLFVPERGDLPNETWFLTADRTLDESFWEKEATVFPRPPHGFALLTDGCEKGSFVCEVPRPEGGGFHDPNQPFPGFFNPVAASLASMWSQGESLEAIQALWETFLTIGHEPFRVESDDRTMILGLWVPAPPNLS